jgi:hypothetical protein
LANAKLTANSQATIPAYNKNNTITTTTVQKAAPAVSANSTTNKAVSLSSATERTITATKPSSNAGISSDTLTGLQQQYQNQSSFKTNNAITPLPQQQYRYPYTSTYPYQKQQQPQANQLPNTSGGSSSSASPSNNGIVLANIQTEPQIVIVGNTFRIGATVINDSPHTITFIGGPCDSPLSTTFDRNVLVQHGPQCYSVAQLVKLTPGQEASVTGPSIGTIYKAISAGQTTAIVTFHYYVTQYYSSSVSKSFVFTIHHSL